MPSNTAGGWPYPLPTEPVRDGAVAIKALADQANKRLVNLSVFGVRTVAAFDANGLWYAPWATWGQTWAGIPASMAMAANSNAGLDAGVNLTIYEPHNSATSLVLLARYVKDGRVFQGNIDVHIQAMGAKP